MQDYGNYRAKSRYHEFNSAGGRAPESMIYVWFAA